MKRKPRTPEELAKPKGFDKFTFYLDSHNIGLIRELATRANVSASQVVNEAIDYYLKSLKVKK